MRMEKKTNTLDFYLLKQISPLQIEHGPQFGRLLTSNATEQTADHAVTTCAQGARAMQRNVAVSAMAPGSWVEADPPQEVTHSREQTPEED